MEAKSSLTALAVPDDGEAQVGLTGLHNHQPRVLVVEDDRTCRRVLLAKLEGLGCRPDAVDTIHKALDALRERLYDLILMDCQMPDGTGCQGARWIRNGAFLPKERPELGLVVPHTHPNTRVPIVAVTADTSERARRHYLSSGMDACVAKPISRRRLRAVVTTWLGTATESLRRSEHALPVMPPTVNLSRAALDAGDFDRDALLGRVTGDERLAQRIVAGFLADLTPYIEQLTCAIDRGSVPHTRTGLHQLIGGATTAGAVRILTLSRRMRDLARAAEMDAVRQLLPELRTACCDFRRTAAPALNRRPEKGGAMARQGTEVDENSGC